MPNNTTTKNKTYPTPDQIIANKIPIEPEIITMTKNWKEYTWKNAKINTQHKPFALQSLCLMIIAYKKTKGKVKYISEAEYSYNPTTQTIILNKQNSIISTLHELAHHLYGPNEYNACRWSIQLFKLTFPRAYSLLKFRGHMLVKHINMKK